MITLRKQLGFTLVEMLVIAPIVILAIGAFIATIVSLTGEVMTSRGSNTLSYDVQEALNRIEADVKLSSTFLPENSITFAAGNPQGYGANGSTANFSNLNNTSSKSLILNAFATAANPTSLSAQYIYLANQPNDCSDPQLYSKNTPMSINIIYYVLDDTLWRRTVLPSDYTTTSTYCGATAPWQRPSCQPGYSHAYCQTNDEKLAEGIAVEDFVISYYSSAASATADVVASTNTDASVRKTALQSSTTVDVTLTARKNIAGRDIERSGTLRVTRLDTNASAIANQLTPTAPSSTPTVSAAIVDGSNIAYTWPAVPQATSYSLDYRVSTNGGTSWGAWTTGNANIPVGTRAHTVSAATHNNVVESRVRANNPTGSSAWTTTSTTIPNWASLVTATAWSDYGGSFTTAGYTKTSDGVVVLKGLIKKSSAFTSGEVIATLPVGYRPSGRLIFGTSTEPNTTARVDIAANGDIIFDSGTASWMSLDTVRFVPDGRYTRTAATLVNSWANYPAPYASASYVQDATGRVHTQGLVGNGVTTNGTIIFGLPAAYYPAKYQHHASRTTGWAHLGVEPARGVLAKGEAGGSSYLSVNSIFYPATTTPATTWTNLNMAASGTGWVYYSDSGGMFSTPQYTKAPDGLVSLKGLIRSGSTTYDTVIATLPTGFRPGQRILAATGNSGVYGRIDIDASGNVRFTGVTNGWYAFDGITFYADQ